MAIVEQISLETSEIPLSGLRCLPETQNPVGLIIALHGGSYTAGSSFVLVSASSGITGTFGTVTHAGAFGTNVRGVLDYSNPNQISACGCGESVQLKPAETRAG